MPVYCVNKPLGLSSHDVVAKARKLLKTRKVGHAGTLDPLATGVLVLLSEQATKLSPFLSSASKDYLAWVSFGASSLTLDSEGPIVEKADASGLKASDIENALPYFLALKEQVPPTYSAVKQGGIKGYEAARKGTPLNLKARSAGYKHIRLLALANKRSDLPTSFQKTDTEEWLPATKGKYITLAEPLGDFPSALFYMRVQSGTYIRAFARDLGEILNLPAHLSALHRTKSGQCDLEDAVELEHIPKAKGLSLSQALSFPQVQLSAEQSARVRQGQRLALMELGQPLPENQKLSLLDESKQLVAVAQILEQKMKLLRVWPNS